MYCPKCRTGVEVSYKFCKSCGFNLSQQTTCSHDTASEPIKAKPAKTEKSICPVCNAVIIDCNAFVACSVCAIKYHTECWKKNFGCSTYGCTMVGGLKQRNEKTKSDSGKPKIQAQSQNALFAVSISLFISMAATILYVTWGRLASAKPIEYTLIAVFLIVVITGIITAIIETYIKQNKISS